MNKLIEDLIKKGMGNFMDRSKDAGAEAWAGKMPKHIVRESIHANIFFIFFISYHPATS